MSALRPTLVSSPSWLSTRRPSHRRVWCGVHVNRLGHTLHSTMLLFKWIHSPESESSMPLEEALVQGISHNGVFLCVHNRKAICPADSLSVITQVDHEMTQSSRFEAALCLDIVLENLVDLEESMIMSYLEDTSMHNDHKDDIDDDSIYSDEEVSYEELQDKYSLLYTKLVRLVKLHLDLKDNLKKIQEQKNALEEINYELIAQVKDATERANVAKGKIARLNTGKAKLDEIISMERSTGMKSGLGYTGTNLNHTTDMHVTQPESTYIMFASWKECLSKTT
ncbi:hypothetical protein M9H77_09299 [Catharanthus roseus]|uniref:Uncharacterized protein n=1 Tax=Catharanthus roseus TaxID=4058 RepID=A0ACC0C078_CATRO|nr:hypothetical protein M9H77_09299 [Catharanthus roseus]